MPITLALNLIFGFFRVSFDDFDDFHMQSLMQLKMCQTRSNFVNKITNTKTNVMIKIQNVFQLEHDFQRSTFLWIRHRKHARCEIPYTYH